MKSLNLPIKERFNDKLSLDSGLLSTFLLRALEDIALVAITDVTGEIVFVNNKFISISKYSREELIGQNHGILKSGGHSPAFPDKPWSTITSGEVWCGEIKSKTKDGSAYWVDSVIAPIFQDNKKVTGYLAVCFPITDRKMAEKEAEVKAKELSGALSQMEKSNLDLINVRKAILNILEDLKEEKDNLDDKVLLRTQELSEEQKKLSSITEHMKDGAVLLSKSGNVLFSNQVVRDFIGFQDGSSTEFLDKFYKHFSNSKLAEKICKCIDNHSDIYIDNVESGEKVYDIIVRDLDERFRNENEQVGVLVFVRDVTEDVALERSKSELVAVASHQLRTPLTAIRGNVEMLADQSFGPVNDEQLELLNDMQISTVRLIMMVNDMLDITKIEKGDLEMKLEEINVVEITSSIIDDLTEYAVKHEFTVNHHQPEQELIVYGDPMRVRQVLQNLIDNSIKYSRHPGKLEISYQESDGRVEITLEDNGIGVPKDEQSKLFGRFYRASNTSKTSSSGSGLGLYIVKSIVEQLGGKIEFQSEEDVGTTFKVALPKPKQSQK